MLVIALTRSHGVRPGGVTGASGVHEVATKKRTGRCGRVVRTLVTGGAGFLGSHLCDALLARSHSVVCVDNLSTGCATNIEHLGPAPTFSFIEGNVLDTH